jgi:hypothetical protein
MQLHRAGVNGHRGELLGRERVEQLVARLIGRVWISIWRHTDISEISTNRYFNTIVENFVWDGCTRDYTVWVKSAIPR